jgi:hypothetical protein
MTDLIQTEAPPPEDIPPPVTPSAAPRPRIVRRGGTPVLLTLLLFALLAGGLGYVYTNPKPQGADSQALEGLTRQIQAQSDAQNTLSTQFQSASQSIGEQIRTLQARMDKLEQALPPASAPVPAPAPAVADTSDLTRRLDELTSKVETLAARPTPEPAAPEPATPEPATPAPAGPSEQQVADLAAKLDQLQAAQKSALDQQAAQDKQALDAADARLEKLEQGAGKVESEADRAARLALVQQASAALQAGTPLGTLPNAPPALARFAITAPPTEAALRNGFAAIADQARAASRPEQAKTTLLDRAWARVEQSVTVRRGDQVIVGDPAAGVLARAQDDVANGDLAGAVHALSALQGPASAAVRPWVEKTQALLDARAALAALAAHP